MIQIRTIDELLPYERNPRKNDGLAVDQVAASIAKHGQVKPIILSEAGAPFERETVCCGHTTLKALKKLGFTEAKCIVKAFASEAEFVDYNVRDNKTSEFAEWDMEELAKLGQEFEVELREMGFEDIEFPDVAEPQDAEPQVDRAAALQELWQTQAGQLWLIGEHRLLCGDSTKAEDVERLMNGEKADLCFTSPPYGQQRDYTSEGKAQVADWDKLMRGVFGNLPMSDAGQVLVNLGLIHREGEWIPYWDGWIEWMREQGWRRFGWYVWDQGSGLPGDWNGRFGPSHEFVFHFNRASVKPDKTVQKNPNSGPMGSNLRSKVGGNAVPNSVCEDKNKIHDSVFRINRNSAHGTGHPATFPVPFAAEVIACWPGLAYEPFCGSGTTMVAAQNLGRKCFGCEISPAYCAVILQRMRDAFPELDIRQA